MRVIDEEGTQLGVMPTPKALQLAQERGFDLVEVAPMSNPPVTKILDYGQYKVRCNVVAPGATRTEMLEEALTPLKDVLNTDVDGVFDCMASNLPLHRVASSDEIAGICSYLASDDSSFMTGSVVLIDGGSHIVDVSGAALTSAGVNWGV